ncbi:MAG TPA: hypothetical protein PLV68_01665 [Ilumatobacteraceae bacterium]|nr:hypothetical protein [Ilumatobacteraceae bacterium]
MSDHPAEPTPTLGRIRFAVLVQHAIEHSGLFSVLGAGWTRVDASTLPALTTINVVAQAEAVPDNGVIITEVVGPDDVVLARSETIVVVRDGPPPVTTALNLSFPVELRAAGRHIVRFGGSVEAHGIDFAVGVKR